MKNHQRAIAKAVWQPHEFEKRCLARHAYVAGLDRVDQIWPWLAENYGDLTAVEAPHASDPEKFSYADLFEAINNSASAFSHLGIQAGDVVALFSENSPRWLITDQGLMRAGGVDAVRGASAPAEELKYILMDSEAVGLVIQSGDLWERLALSDNQKNRLKFVIQLEGPAEKGLIPWNEFLAIGKNNGVDQTSTSKSSSNANQITATILYTSGTTGEPKGVPLTHANLLHQIRYLACIAYPPPGAPVLSVLPIWHAYERSAEYYFFSCACTQTYTTIKHLKRDIPRVRPVVMVTVPRLWEAVKEGFEDALKGMSSRQQNLIRFFLANSGAHKKAFRKARNLLQTPVYFPQRIFAGFEGFIRWPLHLLAAFLLWPKVLKQLTGGRLKYPINGGGAIALHVDEFFESLGVEMLVGYGLTETSPVVSCRRPWRNIRGSSGSPLPGTEFRIVDQDSGAPIGFRRRGLVFVKGPQVMSGYKGKPEASAKVLDSEGWFDTGDLGMLLPDGSLVLTGRAKDTIVLSSGENIEPGPLEEALLASPLINQVMLVGQDKKQLGALVVLNAEAVIKWAIKNKLIIDEKYDLTPPGKLSLRRLLRSELNFLLQQRSGSRSDERLIGIALVHPFSIENGLLTQTLKQRRERISLRDRDYIAEIYGD